MERETARGVVSDVLTSWRSELERLGDHRSDAGERALARVGLVRQEELEELSLRLAQVEHRLRLLERAGGRAAVRTTRDMPAEQTTATESEQGQRPHRPSQDAVLRWAAGTRVTVPDRDQGTLGGWRR